MQKEYPEFGLEGSMMAQGEEIDDRWTLTIEDGKAIRREVVVAGKKITCPHCGEDFILES